MIIYRSRTVFSENMLDEANLIRMAQAGNRDAFKELYMMHKKKVAFMIYRYVLNVEDADDLLQEVFIKAFQSMERFKTLPNTPFLAWLYRIAINTSINFIKMRNKKQDMGQKQDFTYSISTDFKSESPEHVALKKEILEHFNLGLDELTAKQRMIFCLKHFHNLNISEISGHMECSEGSVRKQLYRAVIKLRKNLKKIRGVTHEM